MNNVFKKSLPPAILAFMIFSACENGPEKLSGDLVGFVSVVSEARDFSSSPNYYSSQKEPVYDELYSGSYSGIAVRITGDDFNDEVITDEYGRYIFENIETGIYSLEASKEDCWPVVTTTNFLGGDVPEIADNLFIWEKSKTVISNFKVDFDENSGEFVLSGNCTPAGTLDNVRYAFIFGSTSPDVSNTNFEYMDWIPNIQSIEFEVRRFTIFDSKPSSGQDVYIVAYGFSHNVGNHEQAYTDPNTGQIIYAVNPNASNVVSFTMP